MTRLQLHRIGICAITVILMILIGINPTSLILTVHVDGDIYRPGEDAYSSLQVLDPTLKDSEGNALLSSITKPRGLLISTQITNLSNDTDIGFIVIIEARDDSSGITEFLKSYVGHVNASGMSNVNLPWIPDKAGNYQLRAFAISNFTTPQIFTKISESQVTIGTSEIHGNHDSNNSESDSSINESANRTTSSNNSSGYEQTSVVINGQLLIADMAMTPKQHQLGLSVKQNLSGNEAMLFVFDTEYPYSFWMKGMKFPIDIIWLDSGKRVIHIEHSLTPCQENRECRTYAPDSDSLYILETISGFAEKYDVRLGDKFSFIE